MNAFGGGVILNKRKGASRNNNNMVSKTKSMTSSKSTMNYYTQRKETMGNNRNGSTQLFNDDYYTATSEVDPHKNQHQLKQSRQSSASKIRLTSNENVRQTNYTQTNSYNNTRTNTQSNRHNIPKNSQQQLFQRPNHPEHKREKALSIITTQPKELIADLKRSHSHIDPSNSLRTLKDKIKEYEGIIDKMYFDNSQLTKVNQILLDDLNQLKTEHALLKENSNKEYNKINREKEILYRQLKEMNIQVLSKAKGMDDISRIQALYNASKEQLDEANGHVKNLLTSLENYRNQNDQYKQSIINLEATVERLTKEKYKTTSKSIDSNQRHKDNMILMLEKEKSALERKVKTLEETIASYQNVSSNPMKDNSPHNDFALYIKEKEMMTTLYNLLTNFCLMLKKKLMPYEECLHKQKAFKELIEAIEDDIKILFIKKNYGEMTEENAAIVTESKHRDDYNEIINTFSSFDKCF